MFEKKNELKPLFLFYKNDDDTQPNANWTKGLQLFHDKFFYVKKKNNYNCNGKSVLKHYNEEKFPENSIKFSRL